MFRQRVLLTFSVAGDTRFISHQDMMRVLQRATRRAGLPVTSSQGFNPRPRIAVLQARGVGVSSEVERVEMDFDGWVGPAQVKDSLSRVLPDGIELRSVVLSNPRAHAKVSSLAYRVDFAGPVPFAPDAVQRLLDGPEILVERQRKGKVKTVNLRPVVVDVRIEDSSVFMTFKVLEEGSARPEEILAALGMERKDILSRCTITRTEMALVGSAQPN
jgi:radical SAM-linked protein